MVNIHVPDATTLATLYFSLERDVVQVITTLAVTPQSIDRMKIGFVMVLALVFWHYAVLCCML